MTSSITEAVYRLEVVERMEGFPRTDSDDRLIEIWVHGRSPHTERAYRADVARFRSRPGSRWRG